MRAVLYYLFLPASFLLVLISNLSAQVNIISVRPGMTDSSIETIHGGHLAFINSSVPSKHQLILMIEGTGASARDLLPFDSTLADMGYAVISLDYSNNVITTVCSNSTDSTCFNNFRQEIVFGTPVSPLVMVDTVNSICHRLSRFLSYLVRQYPAQGWDEYIKGEEIQWDRIIAAGHSQGAGHAAYLGKKFRLARVLIFSGPQDYLSYYHEPAGWISDSGQTDPSRYFAFLHLRDPFDFSKQLANCEKLMQIKQADTVMVRPGLPVRSAMHILVTDIQTSNPHGSVLLPEFRQVWEYMLQADTAGKPE